MTDTTPMKCFARRNYGVNGGRDWRMCDRPVAVLIGTGRVPYCEECAASYPKVRGLVIERVRVDGEKKP